MYSNQLPKTPEELQAYIEKIKQESFLDGYRYAIRLLSDSLPSKKIKQPENLTTLNSPQYHK